MWHLAVWLLSTLDAQVLEAAMQGVLDCLHRGDATAAATARRSLEKSVWFDDQGSMLRKLRKWVGEALASALACVVTQPLYHLRHTPISLCFALSIALDLLRQAFGHPTQQTAQVSPCPCSLVGRAGHVTSPYCFQGLGGMPALNCSA